MVDIPNEIELGEDLRMYIVNTMNPFPEKDSPVVPGADIQVSIGVRNTGTVPLKDAKITIQLSNNLIFKESELCTFADGVVTCLVGDLDSGQEFPPDGKLAKTIVTIDPDTTNKVAGTTARFCATGAIDGLEYCTEDKGKMFIDLSGDEPEPEHDDITKILENMFQIDEFEDENKVLLGYLQTELDKQNATQQELDDANSKIEQAKEILEG